MNGPCRCADVVSASPRCTQSLPVPARRTRARRSCVEQRCVNARFNSINAAAALPATERRQVVPATTRHPSTEQLGVGARHGQQGGFASDILGLGQAIVDWSSSVSDELLEQFDVQKGGRRVVNVDERASLMETLDEVGAPSQVSAGGSLANTLVGVSRLARAAGKDLRVSLGGSLGTDTLGQYFNSVMRQAGVRCLLDTHHHNHHSHIPAGSSTQQQPLADADGASCHDPAATADAAASGPCEAPRVGGHTGTVMVLTTPDAQRSFLSFFTSETLQLSDRLRSAVRASRMVVIEGYLWEMPGAEEYICQVLETAHAAGALVAMTAGDPGVVSRHREEMLRVLARGVDMLFTNEAEAAELVGHSAAVATPQGGALDLERTVSTLAQLCPVAVVTAGSHGSYVCAMGEMHEVPPYWLPQGPVDTCGAGDAYAAGWLYSMLAGYDLRTCGEFASRVASAVIGRYGPHLSDADAEALVQQLPEHVGPLRVRLQSGAEELLMGGDGYYGV